jgi:hypothetical protein
MGAILQVRLDDEMTAEVRALQERCGLTASQVLRRGIQLAIKEDFPPASARIAGLGEFDFGPTNVARDMGRMMKGFGQSSLPGGKRRKGKRGR